MKIPFLTASLLLTTLTLSACNSQTEITEEMQGTVTVTTTPANAVAVLTSGKAKTYSLTSGSAVSVPVGSYSMTVSAEGYSSVTQPVTVSAGKDTPLTVNLSLSTGTLTVTGAPTGATLTVTDGAGKTTSLNSGTATTLPVGTYTLTITAPGYATATQQVAVTSGKDTPLTVDLTKTTGTLTVTGAPDGASLTVTDSSGKVTMVNAGVPNTLPVGTYTLKVTANGYSAVSQSVSISAGESAMVTVKLQTSAINYSVSIQGNSYKTEAGTYYGGADVVVSLTPDSDPGTVTVTWTSSKGQVVGSGLTATIPYSDLNKQNLSGGAVVLTAKVTDRLGVRAVPVNVLIDDQAPQADGGVLVKLPGRSAFVISKGLELPASAAFLSQFKDAGVGMNLPVLSAYLNGLLMKDGVTAASDLPEASGYTLRLGTVRDFLGNTSPTTAGADIAGPFNVDLKAPVVVATPNGNVTLAADGAVKYAVSDPRRDDQTQGSGLGSISSDKGGTVSGNVLTLTAADLLAAGAKAGDVVAVTVTATDVAGNTTILRQNITLGGK